MYLLHDIAPPHTTQHLLRGLLCTTIDSECLATSPTVQTYPLAIIICSENRTPALTGSDFLAMMQLNRIFSTIFEVKFADLLLSSYSSDRLEKNHGCLNMFKYYNRKQKLVQNITKHTVSKLLKKPWYLLPARVLHWQKPSIRYLSWLCVYRLCINSFVSVKFYVWND